MAEVVEKKSDKKRKAFLRALASGLSIRDAAKQSGISKNTAYKYAEKLNIEVAKNPKNFVLESVKTKNLYSSSLQKIESLSSSILKELETRDFSQVSTDKLLDNFLKYQNSLKESYTPVNQTLTDASIEKVEDVLNFCLDRVKRRLMSNDLNLDALRVEMEALQVARSLQLENRNNEPLEIDLDAIMLEAEKLGIYGGDHFNKVG